MHGGGRDCAMDALASPEGFLFEDFRLDQCGGGLFRRAEDGTFTAVAISSRGRAILGVMVEKAGEGVSKAEIIAAVWCSSVVDDRNLTVQISTARLGLRIAAPDRGC